MSAPGWLNESLVRPNDALPAGCGAGAHGAHDPLYAAPSAHAVVLLLIRRILPALQHGPELHAADRAVGERAVELHADLLGATPGHGKRQPAVRADGLLVREARAIRQAIAVMPFEHRHEDEAVANDRFRTWVTPFGSAGMTTGPASLTMMTTMIREASMDANRLSTSIDSNLPESLSRLRSRPASHRDGAPTTTPAIQYLVVGDDLITVHANFGDDLGPGRRSLLRPAGRMASNNRAHIHHKRFLNPPRLMMRPPVFDSL